MCKSSYRVRATVRSLKREADVRAMLKAKGEGPRQGMDQCEIDPLLTSIDISQLQA